MPQKEAMLQYVDFSEPIPYSLDFFTPPTFLTKISLSSTGRGSDDPSSGWDISSRSRTSPPVGTFLIRVISGVALALAKSKKNDKDDGLD